MAVVPIISQSWDTTSYVNPTRMNNIETNISTLSKATGIEYSSGVSIKDKIESMETATGGSCTDTTLTVSLIKVGRIVFGNINDGNASASAGGVIAKFPSGFVPNSNSRCDFRDSYSQKRLQVKSEGIIAMESVNNILRGTFVYYV